MLRDPILSRIVWVALALMFVMLGGTIGFAVIEGWSLSEGLYMTAITTSTVGYGEPHELSTAGRSFTSALIALSVVIMTCWNAALTSFLVDGDVSGRYARKRTLKMIASLKGHTIVCGAGIVGRAVVERLARRSQPIVVIGADPDELRDLQRAFRNVHTIVGRATDELTLAQANIMSASSVVAVLESEVDNLLVGITCKDLGSDVSVLARSETASVANRMRKAGVDEVICPPEICGDRIASLITQ